MLDPQEEKEFDDLKKKFGELNLPTPPEIMIGLEVRDGDGNVTLDDIQRGHSWTRNYWNNFYCFVCGSYNQSSGVHGPGTLTVLDNTGNPISYGNGYTYQPIDYDSIEGNVNGGIVVGSSNDVFDLNDYLMGSVISHGTGTGQLYYNLGYRNSSVYTTKVWSVDIVRVFNNNSTGNITVNEVGMRGLAWHILFERSVLVTPIVLVPDSRITVSYTISMNFTSID